MNLCKTATIFTTRLNVPPKNISQSRLPMSSLFHLCWRSTSPGPPSWSWRERQSLRPPPPAPAHLLFPWASLHLSLWGDIGTAFSATPPPAQPSSPLKVHLLPAQPSPLPLLPPGHCTLGTWQSPHLAKQLLPLPSQTVGTSRGGGTFCFTAPALALRQRLASALSLRNIGEFAD